MKVFSMKTLQFEIGQQIAHFRLVEKGKNFRITDLALQSFSTCPVLSSFIHKTQAVDWQ